MTRLAVLSDIHGNLPALEAVLSDLRQFTVDQVVVLGDVINWGPFSREVLERVLNAGWPVVRGNNELYLLDYDTPRAPQSWATFTLPPWLHTQVGDYLPELSSWPDTIQLRFRDAATVRAFHGVHDNPWRAIHPLTPEEDAEALLAPVAEGTILAGHSHLPLDTQIGRWHVLNPGTVGNPLDGKPGASYLLVEGDWDGWRGTLRRVPCDFSPCVREFARQDFVGQVGPIGRLIIEEFKTHSLYLHPFKVWLSVHFPGGFPRDHDLTHAVIDEFLALDEDTIESYKPPEYRRATF